MTNNLIPNDIDKGFENANETIHNKSLVTDSIHNSDICSLNKALYYHSYYDINTVPIPKPGEKIGQVWDEEKQILLDIAADGKSAKGYNSWSYWRSKQQTADDVIGLFSDKPDCNIAALTGKVSKIIAFDIDGEAAQKYFDQIIGGIDDEEIKNCIYNTMQTKTGSGCGKHVVIAINPDEFQNVEKVNTTTLWTGNGNHSEIKLKGEGSYIIVPPSVSSTGIRYQFISQVKPAVLTKQKLHKILSAFDSQVLSNACHKDGKINNRNNNDITEKNTTYRKLSTDKIKYIVVSLSAHYSEGQRDDIIFGLGGLLFKSNISLSSAKVLVSELCDNTKDKEKDKRIEVLEDTYFKGLNGKNITGYDRLVKTCCVE